MVWETGLESAPCNLSIPIPEGPPGLYVIRKSMTCNNLHRNCDRLNSQFFELIFDMGEYLFQNEQSYVRIAWVSAGPRILASSGE